MNDDKAVNTKPVDLRNDGVLWMINRSLFHPLGFALAYSAETGEFTLWGNGDEPWSYSSEVDEDTAFGAFQALLNSVKE